MGGFSWLVPRPAAAGDPTHALFAGQSHSIVDNLVALLRHSRAWNCSSANCMDLVRDQSVHSRFLVLSGHAFIAPVLLNVTHERHQLRDDRFLRSPGRPAASAERVRELV